MSYYQKYRPRKISELNLVGVRDTFGSFLKSGKISHAYLFVGPRGSGKTSAARILAALVNCDLNKSRDLDLLEPCGECDSCKNLLKSSSVDVIEIDAASNGLVEDIRDLREKVKLAPVSLRKKVYIIDEVHMVSTAGFNALLKTLEEPPSHAMFILCTTEAHKVPDTIVSRCIKVAFTKATDMEMNESLKRVAAAEGLTVSESTLSILSQMSDGSFREAHKLLEQLASFGTEIDESMALEKLGGASKVLIKMAVESSLAHDPVKVLEVFGEIERSGAKASVVLSSLVSYLKQQLELSVRSGANVKEILKMLELLITASEKIKVSPEPLLPLEIALLQIAVGGGVGGASAAVTGAPANGLKNEDKVAAASVGETESVITKPVVEVIQKDVVSDQAVTLAESERVVQEWESFLDNFANSNGSLAGLLRNCKPKGIDGKSLIVEVRSRFQKDMLERDVKKKVIEEEMEKIWGPITLKTILQEGETRTEPNSDDVNVTVTSVEVEKIFG